MTQPANINRFPELASQAELDAEARRDALQVRLIWAGALAFVALTWWGVDALVAAVLW